MENYRNRTLSSDIDVSLPTNNLNHAYTLTDIFTVLIALSHFAIAIFLIFYFKVHTTIMIFFDIGIMFLGIISAFIFHTFVTMLIDLCADVRAIRKTLLKKTTISSPDSDTISYR